MRFKNNFALMVGLTESVIFLSTSWAMSAENSLSIHLDAPGGSMSQVQTRNQGRNGICASESAAEMLDAWRFSHGDKNTAFQTSAYSIAVDTGSRTQLNLAPNFDNGAFIESALSAGIEQGLCNRNTFFEQVGEPWTSAEATNLLAWNQASANYLNNRNDINGYETWLQKANSSAFEQIAFRSGKPNLFPNLSFLRQTFSTVRPDEQLKTVFDLWCDSHHRISVPLKPNVYFTNAVDLENKAKDRIITAALNQSNPQPVGLSYCSKVIESKNYAGVHPGTNNSSDCGEHASIVIGMRTFNGKKQFLVRNSWGPNCGGYKSWDCDQNGSFWIDAPVLTANIYRIAVLATELSGELAAGLTIYGELSLPRAW